MISCGITWPSVDLRTKIDILYPSNSPFQDNTNFGLYAFYDNRYWHIVNKSDAKSRITLSCNDKYTYRELKLWNSHDCEAV